MSQEEGEKQGESHSEEMAKEDQPVAEPNTSSLSEFAPGPNAVDITEKSDGGVLKEIRKPGEGDEHPMSGDTVFVHYVGTLTDGTKFDSSRDRNKFFEFQLGKGSVIKGWDLAVATMKKGELCVIRCAPEYAYGKKGSKPKIPPNSPLLFEIELFDWKGEDISEEKDGSLLKSLIKEGDGYKTPMHMATCEIHILGKDGDRTFQDEDVSFGMGEGFEADLIQGIEKAVKDFKLGEKAKLKIASKYAYGTEGNSRFSIAPNTDLEYVVELKSFENIPDSWQLQIADKFTNAEILKTKGNHFFKLGRYEVAQRYYQKIAEYFKDEEKLEGEQAEMRNKVYLMAHLNIAMSYLKLQNDLEALHSCDEALKLDPQNEKGLFRRGTANLNLFNFEDALRDFREVLVVDPTNKAAKNQATQIAHKLKQMKEKEKKTYAGMFDKFAKEDEKKAPIKLWKEEGASELTVTKSSEEGAADHEEGTNHDEDASKTGDTVEQGQETEQPTAAGDQPEAQPA